MIVTGASSGIGRALALAAARDGFGVVIVARRAERLTELANAIAAQGGASASVVADVTAPDAPARIVDAALQTFGRLDVVVNNAGAGAHGMLLDQSDADIEAQWRLHLLAPLRIARLALPHLRKTHGQLIFVGSGVARIPVPGHGAYAPAKAAIRAAATQLRRELHDDHIAVTYLDPGLVATEFHETLSIERPANVPAAPPERVARAVMRSVERRSATAHGTPLQTFGAMIGEWSSTLADPTLRRMVPKKVPGAATAAAAEQCHAEPVEAQPPSQAGSLEQALEPVARRMERVKLPQSFVEQSLVPGATLDLNEVSMRWAGMPNKNERAAMREVLDALASAGYLEPTGEESWKVVRAAR